MLIWVMSILFTSVDMPQSPNSYENVGQDENCNTIINNLVPTSFFNIVKLQNERTTSDNTTSSRKEISEKGLYIRSM